MDFFCEHFFLLIFWMISLQRTPISPKLYFLYWDELKLGVLHVVDPLSIFQVKSVSKRMISYFCDIFPWLFMYICVFFIYCTASHYTRCWEENNFTLIFFFLFLLEQIHSGPLSPPPPNEQTIKQNKRRNKNQKQNEKSVTKVVYDWNDALHVCNPQSKYQVKSACKRVILNFL